MAVQRPIVIIGVKKSNFQGVVDFANNVVVQMTAAAATFTAPLPLLATITADATAAQAAITAWGVVGARGSHADYLNLQAAIQVLYTDLLEEMAYVQNTCYIAEPTNYSACAALILSSGYGAKNNPTPQGRLNPPQNVRRTFNIDTPLLTVKLQWNKPLGLRSPNNVKMYGIYRSVTNDFTASTRVGTSTRTTFSDSEAPHGTNLYYWVVGFNAAGQGVESMVFNTSTAVA